MADLVPVDADLPTLAMCINEQHQLAHAALRAGLEHARTAGELLLQAKVAVPHGGWLPWLKANCLFSERTPQNYMRIAGHWNELTANPQRVADLSYREGVKLLSVRRSRDELLDEAMTCIAEAMQELKAQAAVVLDNPDATMQQAIDLHRAAALVGQVAHENRIDNLTYLGELLNQQTEAIATP